MIKGIKAKLQDRIYQNCLDEYEQQIRYNQEPYMKWIRETEYTYEQEGEKEEIYPSLCVVYMDKCQESFNLSKVKGDIVIFASREGRISVQTFREINKVFEENEDVDIVYGDEDMWMISDGTNDHPDDETLHRTCPWQKPVWSPDTLFSYNYFGNLFAIRKETFLEIEWLKNKNFRMNIYDFLLKATEISDSEKRIKHIDKILFHAYYKAKDMESLTQKVMIDDKLMPEAAKEYDFIREAALIRRGKKARFIQKDGFSYPVYETTKNPLVSIIIPSKDNVEILKRCIDSIYDKTAYKNFEIIVVDNGSSNQNRMSLQVYMTERTFDYYYMPMDFNFSKMCNEGVAKSKGDYILLLNDDMEVIEPDWLEKMLGQAMLPHVGAVGAKLLYPGTKLIQHAGVTNTYSGPGHKLKQMDDSLSYYFGRNKLIHDMIGVTAACLLISKVKYNAIGGLFEDLKVAYNDVDFCFRLYNQGFYNVLRNDVILYHHESLSRGDDLIDEKKLKRLLEEMDVLYSRHPKLYRKDPFNGDLMNSGYPEYSCRIMEVHELYGMTGYHDKVTPGKKLPDEQKMNHAIMNAVEEAGIDKHLDSEKNFYKIKGWAVVPNVDNVRYSFKVLLKNKAGKVYEIQVVKQYRKDVANIIDNAQNVMMSGFCCWILEGDIPKDTYDIWLYAKDACSRQCMYRDTEKQIVIE